MIENFWLNKTCNIKKCESVLKKVLDFKKDITVEENDTINIYDLKVNLDDADDIYNNLTTLIEKGKVNIINYQVTDNAYSILKKLTK